MPSRTNRHTLVPRRRPLAQGNDNVKDYGYIVSKLLSLALIDEAKTNLSHKAVHSLDYTNEDLVTLYRRVIKANVSRLARN